MLEFGAIETGARTKIGGNYGMTTAVAYQDFS